MYVVIALGRARVWRHRMTSHDLAVLQLVQRVRAAVRADLDRALDDQPHVPVHDMTHQMT